MRRPPWCLCSLWWVLDRQRLQPSTAVLQRQSDKLTADDSVNSLDPPRDVRGAGDRGVRSIIAWPHYFQKTQQSYRPATCGDSELIARLTHLNKCSHCNK